MTTPLSDGSRPKNTQDKHSPRRDIISMAVPYSLGVFNDNFFKQAVMLLALSAAMPHLQGWGTILFSLPFVLFSAWAGWLADRMTKRFIIIISKVIELAAMLLALWALAALNWPGLLAVVFLMSAQSTLFSPAINGSIPELLPAEDVPGANAAVKLTTTCMMLAGIALSGIVLDFGPPGFLAAPVSSLPEQGLSPFGRALAGGTAVFASLAGLVSAFAIRRRPPACPAGSRSAAPFPLFGPVDSLRQMKLLRERPLLARTLWGEAFFYFISSFGLLCINAFSKIRLGFSDTMTSVPVTMLMVGVCLGSVSAAKKNADAWKSLTLPTCLAMSAGFMFSALAPLLPRPLVLPWLMGWYVITGWAAGMFLIPQVSCNQIYPAADEKGKIIGLSNFMSFCGILLAGVIYALLSDGKSLFSLSPAWMLVLAALLTAAFAVLQTFKIARLAPASLADCCLGPARSLLWPVLALRYKITVNGLEKIAPASAEKPILFLPNHPAYVDPVIVYITLSGLKPRPMADSAQVKRGLPRLAKKLTDTITIPDLRKDGGKSMQGVLKGLDEVAGSLRSGRCVMLYPSGTLYRGRLEKLCGNSGVARILEALPEARVVLARTRGLWGSSFSCVATGANPSLRKALGNAALTLLLNGIFFAPRRAVSIDFLEPQDLPRPRPGEKCDRKALNAYMQDFFNEDAPPATAVSRFFWQGRKIRVLPDPLPEKPAEHPQPVHNQTQTIE